MPATMSVTLNPTLGAAAAVIFVGVVVMAVAVTMVVVVVLVAVNTVGLALLELAQALHRLHWSLAVALSPPYPQQGPQHSQG